MARAMSSLPVPVSPTIKTQARDGDTWRVVRTTSRRLKLQPITPGSVSSLVARCPVFLESSDMTAHPSPVLSTEIKDRSAIPIRCAAGLTHSRLIVQFRFLRVLWVWRGRARLHRSGSHSGFVVGCTDVGAVTGTGGKGGRGTSARGAAVRAQTIVNRLV